MKGFNKWSIIKKQHFDTKIDEIPVTGRSINYYLKALFPDFKSKNDLLKYLKNKKYVDVGCGVNHMRNDSLLSMLIKINNNSKVHNQDAYGIDIVKLPKHTNYKQNSIYDTKLTTNSIDFITINNLLYFHLYKKTNIIKSLKEMHRILKPNGEIRIFPIFFGEYYYGDIKLRDYINSLFFVRVIKPKPIPLENPIFFIDGEVIKSDSVGKGEIDIMKKLNSYILIMKKI